MNHGFPIISRTWLRLLSIAAVIAILVQISGPAIVSASGGISRYSGVDVAHPSGPVGESSGASGSSNPLSASSVTGESGDVLVFLASVARKNANIRTPAGMTGRYLHNPRSDGAAIRSAEESLTSDGPTGARTTTSSPVTDWVAQLVLLRAAPPPFVPTTVVHDNFRDVEGTSLTSHTPDVDEVGGGWIEDLFSDFRITGESRGAVMDITELHGARIATVDTLLSEYELSVDITRDVSANDTGVVVRYQDADNYFVVFYDGFWLRLVRVLDGEEELLVRRPVPLWLNGTTATLRVVIEDDVISVAVGGWLRFSRNDSALSGVTRAGLYFRSNVESRFHQIKVEGLAEAPGAAPVPTPNPLALEDTFSSPDGTSLNAHASDLAPATGWQEVVGDWSISGGAAVLSAPSGGGDQFAVISTGIGDQTISVDITYFSGLAGITWNRDNAANFHFLFFDGIQLVLARVEDGAFIEHGRKPLVWQPGQTRKVTVRVNGTSVRVYMDGSDIIMMRAINMTQNLNGNAGLFARFTTANTFDNFTARLSTSLAHPDPDIAHEVPYVPPPATIPPDAWLYDSFNAHNLTWLQFRDPDLDPSDQGWTIASGKWFTWGSAASENSRVYDTLPIARHAMIDSGRDEYEMKVDVTWAGDRVGVLFGGRASNPEDAGVNQFGVWKNGDGDLVLTHWVGGVPYTIGGEWVEPVNVSWLEGQTKQVKVVVEGTRASIYLDGHKMFEFVDQDLQYGTWVGLFQRGKHDERYDNFQVSLLPGHEPPDNPPVVEPISNQTVVETQSLNVSVIATDVDGDPIALSLGVGAPQFASMFDNGDGTGTVILQPELGDLGTYTVDVIAANDNATVTSSFNVIVKELTVPVDIVIDTFADGEGIDLPAHFPDLAPSGSSWGEVSEFGDWKITGNRAEEVTLIPWADHRLVIDTTQSDGRTSVDIEHNGGLTGLTVRYIDESQMILAWIAQNPSGAEAVLGYIVPGAFIELARGPISDVGLTWGIGETHNFAVIASGTELTVEVDGIPVLYGTLSLYTSATGAGLFARSDIANFFDNFNHTIQIPASNQPPVFDPIADQTVDEGNVLSVAVVAVDPDGDVITLQPGAGFPSFGTFTDNGDGTGSVEFAPGYDDAGTIPIEIVALTLAGSSSITFDLIVNNFDRLPVIEPIADQTVDEGDVLSVAVVAVDSDGDAITLQPGAGFPSFGTLVDNGDGTGSVEFAPGFDEAGTIPIEIVALTLAGSSSITFDLTVNNVDRLPVIEPIADQTVLEDDTLFVPVSGFDPDIEIVALSLVSVHPFISITDNGDGTGEIEISPTSGDAGTYTIEVQVSNAGGSASTTFELTVVSSNQPPVFDPIDDQSVDEGDVLSVAIVAIDPDGDAITLQPGAGFPSFGTLIDNGDGTGSVEFAPGYDDAGTIPIEIVALTLAGSSSTTFDLTVNNVDRLPVINPIGNQSLPESNLLVLPVSSYDLDGDPITLSLALGAPGFASVADFGDGTGEITLSPQAGEAGSYLIEVVATTAGGAATTTFSVLVSAAPSGGQMVLDTFTDADDTTIPPHAPDVAPPGSSWSEASDWGDWKIVGNRATEFSLIPWADHRVVIDSGEVDGVASVDVEYDTGNAGLTFRYVDELNWVMAWIVHNGANGQIVLAYLDGGNFVEVDRVDLPAVGLSWNVGETHELSVRYVGDNIRVYVDGTLVTERTLTVLQSGTHVGLFARGDTPNYFDNFEVTTP